MASVLLNQSPPVPLGTQMQAYNCKEVFFDLAASLPLLSSPPVLKLKHKLLVNYFKDALEGKSDEMAALFSEMFPYLDLKKRSKTLNNALEKGDLPLIKLLIPHVEMYFTKMGLFLQVSSIAGDVVGVNEILRSPQFPNLPQIELLSSLWIAAENGHLAVVKAFLALDCIANFPLHVIFGLGHALNEAAAKGHLAVVNALLTSSHTANLQLDGHFSVRHAVERAQREGHDEVVNLLNAYIQIK